MGARTLLIATDYSDASDRALRYAASLARDLGARLLIAHVSEHELLPVGESVAEIPAPNEQELARLHQVKPPIADVPYEHALLFAEPSCQNVDAAHEIIRCADRAGVEAIVVGAHDRSLLSRALTGSVAERLSRRAHCPVVIVRGPRASRADE